MDTLFIQLHRRSILTRRLMHWEIIAVTLSSLGATVQITLRLKLWTLIINVVPFVMSGKRVLTIHFQIQTCKFIQLKRLGTHKHISVSTIIRLFPRKKLFSSLAVTVQMA